MILDGLRALSTVEAPEEFNLADLLETAQDISNCVQCGVDLVESLQNLDKLENGLLFLHQREHFVVPFVEDCVRPFLLHAEQRGIHLRMHNGPILADCNDNKGIHGLS
jgi:hypothetical protein